MTHDPTRDCEHGRMKGKCDVCDLQAEVVRLIDESQRLRAELKFNTPPAPQPVPVKTYHDGKPWPVQPSQSAPDYAWPTIEDYEKEVGFEVNDAFKAAWTMARTTNDLFKQMGANHD